MTVFALSSSFSVRMPSLVLRRFTRAAKSSPRSSLCRRGPSLSPIRVRRSHLFLPVLTPCETVAHSPLTSFSGEFFLSPAMAAAALAFPSGRPIPISLPSFLGHPKHDEWLRSVLTEVNTSQHRSAWRIYKRAPLLI